MDFDENLVTFEELLDRFVAYLESTGITWQSSGYGSQYRHAVFCVDEAQLLEAQGILDRTCARMGGFTAVLVEMLRNFFPAEDYHQAHPKG